MKRPIYFSKVCALKDFSRPCVECGKIINTSEMYLDINAMWGKGSREHCFDCAARKDKKLKDRYKEVKNARNNNEILIPFEVQYKNWTGEERYEYSAFSYRDAAIKYYEEVNDDGDPEHEIKPKVRLKGMPESEITIELTIEFEKTFYVKKID